MRTAGTVLTAMFLAIAGLAITGCGTSAAFPFDYDTVWRAAVGEAIVWHPDLIDDQQRPYRVSCTKTNLDGMVFKYELEVVNDLNLFARRPSTRVYVNMRQTKPRRVRFTQMEKEFLGKIADRLTTISSPPG
ncbi:MAG: hypothetical protein SVV80_02320 [Planctomycetota bacterium]|nr:hypothetical protein [Planctomycetota bacterium]